MEISGVSTGVLVDSAAKNKDVVTNTEVVKKTQDIESQTKTQTENAVPQSPDNLGNNIDVKV